MSEQPARPPQVTAAAWMVIVGSVLVVLMAFDQVADLRSLETREGVEDYLSKPPGDSLGLGVEGVLSLLRVALMVAAACAAAAAILGYQVLQRSRSARLALSVLAAPLFLTGLASGGLASAVVTAAVVMLWFQPARDWFDGRTRRAAPVRTAPAAPVWPPVPPQQPEVRLDDLPPPQGPPAFPTTYGVPTQAPPVAEGAGPRPAAVLWACVLTWVFSALAFGALALTLGVMLASPDLILDEAYRQNPDLAEQGVTDAVLRNTVYITAGLVMVWSAAAAFLAVLAWRRVRPGATWLVVSAGSAGGLCLVLVLGSLALLLPLAACVVTVALMLRPEVRRWYAAGVSR